MPRLRTCTECGETKDNAEFISKDGKRISICKECGNQEFLDAIENMGDEFTPVEKLELPDDDE